MQMYIHIYGICNVPRGLPNFICKYINYTAAVAASVFFFFFFFFFYCKGGIEGENAFLRGRNPKNCQKCLVFAFFSPLLTGGKWGVQTLVLPMHCSISMGASCLSICIACRRSWIWFLGWNIPRFFFCQGICCDLCCLSLIVTLYVG